MNRIGRRTIMALPKSKQQAPEWQAATEGWRRKIAGR